MRKKLICMFICNIFLMTFFLTIHTSTIAKSMIDISQIDDSGSGDSGKLIKLIRWIAFAKGTFYVEDNIMKGVATKFVDIHVYLIVPIPHFATNVSLNLSLSSYIFFIRSDNLLIYTSRPHLI